MRGRLFWLISRVAIVLYRHFPVFGRIRGAVGIVRRDGGFVVLKRSDGYGYGFPGGIRRPFEGAESALRREIAEETGLKLISAEQVLQYEDEKMYPSSTTVFEAIVEGEIRSSWEGEVVVASLSELQQKVMPAQRRIVEHLRQGANGGPGR